MIDLHCHYLPGIDDGARDLKASLALASAAVNSGITHAICTPHIHYGHFDNDIEKIERAHDAFSLALARESIPLKTYFGAEIRICPEIVQLKMKAKLPYIGNLNGKPVLLLELPHSHIPVGAEKLIKWLKDNDVIPLIAHPERNRDIISNYSKANWLKGKGVLFQITAGAIAGTFGKNIQNCAFNMLQDNYADIVATDAHNLHKRPPQMKEAFQIIEARFNYELANRLCVTAPWEIAKCWFGNTKYGE